MKQKPAALSSKAPTKSSKAPAWLGWISFAGGYVAYVIFIGLYTGTLQFGIGLKGEGLLFILLFYVVIRIIVSILWHFLGKKNDPC